MIEYFDYSCNWMSFARSGNTSDVDKIIEYSVRLNGLELKEQKWPKLNNMSAVLTGNLSAQQVVNSNNGKETEKIEMGYLLCHAIDQ